MDIRLLFWTLRTAALAVVILLALTLSESHQAQATTLSPLLELDVSDIAPGANGDVITTFFIGESDSFPSNATAFTPPGWGVATDTDVPTGAVVGSFASTPTVSILNGACSVNLPTVFTLLDSLADPLSASTIGGSPSDDAWVGYQDTDGDGLAEAVDNWPTFLDARLAQLGNATPIARYYGQTTVAGTLVALHIMVFNPGDLPGFRDVVGFPSDVVLLDPFAPLVPSTITGTCSPLSVVATIKGLSLDNGATPDVNEAGFVLRTNPVEGEHTFTVLAVSGRDSEPSCKKSPKAGFNCDGDGIENLIDTCPLVPNVGDPRVPGSGDPDNDGIDSACDPNLERADLIVLEDLSLPGTCSDNLDNDSDSLIDAADTGCQDTDGDGVSDKQDNCDFVANAGQLDSDLDQTGDACDPDPFAGSILDVDGDGFLNRQDNCALVPNGGAAQAELAELSNPNPPPPPASRTDGIGDQCDPHPDVPDGHFHAVEVTDDFVIGPHDIKLASFRGAKAINGGQTKIYTVSLVNRALLTEEIQVGIGAFPIASAGCASPFIPGGVPLSNGTVLFTSVTAAPRERVTLKVPVTFPVCGPDIDTPVDYNIIVDACHSADPPFNQLIFQPVERCPGTTDGGADPRPGNDTPISISVNDRNR